MSNKNEHTKRKSIVMTNYTGGNNLKVEETDIPTLKPHDVRVRVKFCGINFAECMMRQGLYSAAPPAPAVPGYEASGIVDAVGGEVHNFKLGDRVVVMENFGTWQEFLVIPSDQVFKIPETMTLEQAAAIPVNYVTASIMLFDQANLREGESVLVHMAAGGVGTAVGQLCKTVHNVTVFGTASESKHEHCKHNGITYPIDYNTKDYVKEVKALAPSGVDIVLDPLGGPDSSKSHSLLRPLGKHIHYGAANMMKGTWRSMITVLYNSFFTDKYDPFDLMNNSKMVGGLHVGKLMEDPSYKHVVRKHMEQILHLCQENKLSPVIDTIWPFEQAMEAMGRIYEKKNVGKVLLTPDKVHA